MTTEIATIDNYVNSVRKGAMALAKNNKSFNLQAEMNYAIQQLKKNDYNIRVAMASPESVQNAVLNMAAIGISLNPAMKHAYLVPRDNVICLDISYMGLMHIAQEIGSILWGQAKIVYANDTYENQGVDKAPLHKFNSFGDRGEKVGVYCTVKLPNGDFLTEEMDAAQVNQVRNTSKAKDSKYSPWVTFEEEMWRKTVVKRASKYWPKSSDKLDRAIDILNQSEGMEEKSLNPDYADALEKAAIKINEYNTDEYTPIELYALIEWYRSENGEDFYMSLFNVFEKGKKVAGKDKIREGGKQFRQYLEIFKEGGELALSEAMDELTEREIKIIQRSVGN